MTVRIEEVASACQVSTATVSRALRGLPGVGEKTRQHVLKTAQDLGYTPSPTAASLASGHTHSIGLVQPDMSRWFFGKILESAERTFRKAGYDALVYSLPDYLGPVRERFNPDVIKGKVDAVVVLSLFFDPEEEAQLRALGIPVVFVSVQQPGFAYVGIDDEEAAARACRHLITLGHKRIGHLSGQTNDKCPVAPTQRRREGWCKTMERFHLESSEDLDEAVTIMTASNGYLATNRLLDRRPDITAILASSDEMAMGAIHAIRSRGLQPGRDISVMGIDGHDLGAAFDLSTMAQPVHQEGTAAARLALDAIAGRGSESETVVFPTTLVERSSAKSAHK
ncbi:LacI family transcriptional regulator [Bombiscardovia apis]|uniref:LacI family transcriptional regulator n=1 Tax=Bombiscardovia apis TaxID=2932182 RepID=A0ABN6SJ24_9BIFI|nr:LacI family DNA-binding transcriptional regulator [Bombiscardovia apis]BDR55292.1 LacI family transcriptional regulator [Bombiscardovia apis]